MDLHLQILELGLDAKTWIDYILHQTRDSMQHEPSSLELTDIAAGVERGASDLAVLSLYRLAAHRVDRTFSPPQRAVVVSAVACSEDAV